MAQLAILALCLFALAYARAALGPLQEAISQGLGFDDNQIALLQGLALSLPFMVLGIPLGHAIDRFSRARLIALFMSAGVAGSALTAIASDFWLLFAGRSLVGLAAIAAAVTALSLVADLYHSHQRGRAITVVSIAQIVGSACAFALGGAILGQHDAGSAWRLAAWVPAGLLALLLAAAFALREPACGRKLDASPRFGESLHELWDARARIVPLLAGAVIVGVADGASLVWAAPNFARRFALGSESVGFIVGASLMVSGLAGPILGGIVADACQRRGGPSLTLLALAIFSAASALTGFFAILRSAGFSAILFGLFLTLGSAIGIGYLTVFTVLVPERLRGLCIAAGTLAGLIFGVSIAPLTVSAIATILGDQQAIAEALSIVCVGASLVACLAFAIARHAVSKVATA